MLNLGDPIYNLDVTVKHVHNCSVSSLPGLKELNVFLETYLKGKGHLTNLGYICVGYQKGLPIIPVQAIVSGDNIYNWMDLATSIRERRSLEQTSRFPPLLFEGGDQTIRGSYELQSKKVGDFMKVWLPSFDHSLTPPARGFEELW